MKELTPLLEKLALKLGVTINMLWSSLIRQAPISATTDLVLSVGLVSSLIWAFRFVIKKTTPFEGKSYGDWYGEGEFWSWLILTIYTLFAAVGLINAFQNMVIGFFNPQYWALKEILHLCK